MGVAGCLVLLFLLLRFVFLDVLGGWEREGEGEGEGGRGCVISTVSILSPRDVPFSLATAVRVASYIRQMSHTFLFLLFLKIVLSTFIYSKIKAYLSRKCSKAIAK